MTHWIKMAGLAVAVLAIALSGTGCTSTLHTSNKKYVQRNREFQRPGQRLIGSYIGMDSCKGTLCEIYQFESPFQTADDDVSLEVLIPVYGCSGENPVRVYETRRRRVGNEAAELWFWGDKRIPSTIKSGSEGMRRVDVLWTGGDRCSLRRHIPNAGLGQTNQWSAKLKIPWHTRNRLNYAARNLAYACTIPTDIVAGAGVVTVLAFIYCPCGMVALIQALD